jgi:hypothetical protein
MGDIDDIQSPTAEIFPEYFQKKPDFEEELKAFCRQFQAEMLQTCLAKQEEMGKFCRKEIKKTVENADLKVLEIKKSVENDTEQTRLTRVSNEKRGKLIANLMILLSKKVDPSNLPLARYRFAKEILQQMAIAI